MANIINDRLVTEEFFSKDSLLLSILNNSAYFVAVYSSQESKFIFVNEAACRLFETKDEILLKKLTPSFLFASKPTSEINNEWEIALKDHRSYRQVSRFITLKENEFWGLHDITLFNHEGKNYELHCITDVSEMKDSELIADRERKKFSTLFENSTIGILVCNSKGNIEIINSYAEKQFGYAQNELIGKKVEQLIPHELTARHVMHRNSFIEAPHTRPMGIGLNLFGVQKNKSQFPVEISLSHYSTSEGTFVIAFISDITVRKKNEDAILMQQNVLQKYAAEVRALNQELEQRVADRTLALREAMQQLEASKEELADALTKEKELSDLKSRFVSMASHEFRTPLSTILSSAALIEKYKKEEEQEKRLRHIDRIKENVKNLNDILEDFLSLGKLEEGLILTSGDKIILPVFINEIIDDMQEVKKESQNISYSHSGSLEFYTDKHVLKNVLINLLTNAIKFSRDGGNIELESISNKNQLTLTIKDHGIGISEEDQEHLFERFFRGKNALNIKGTGLGLHIVSKYLKLINGTITCDSHLEEGTSFTIVIDNIL